MSTVLFHYNCQKQNVCISIHAFPAYLLLFSSPLISTQAQEFYVNIMPESRLLKNGTQDFSDVQRINSATIRPHYSSTTLISARIYYYTWIQPLNCGICHSLSFLSGLFYCSLCSLVAYCAIY